MSAASKLHSMARSGSKAHTHKRKGRQAKMKRQALAVLRKK